MSKSNGKITRREFFKRSGAELAKVAIVASGLETMLTGCSPQGVPIYTSNNGHLTAEGIDFLLSLNDGGTANVYSYTPGFANLFNIFIQRLLGKEVSKDVMVRFKGSVGGDNGEHSYQISCKNGNVKIYGLATILKGLSPSEAMRTLLHEYTHQGHGGESVPCFMENLANLSIPFIFGDVPEMNFDKKIGNFKRTIANIRATYITSESEGFGKYELPDLITLLVLNEVLMNKNAQFGDVYYRFEKDTLHFHSLAHEFINYSRFRSEEEVEGIFGPSSYKDINGNLISYPETTASGIRSHFNLSATFLANIVTYQLLKNHLDNGVISAEEFEYSISQIKSGYLHGSIINENGNQVITLDKNTPRIIKPGFAESHPLIYVPDDYDPEYLI